MLIDASLGIFSFVFVSLLFDKGFNSWMLLFALFFVFLPDLDFIPFAVLRRRLNLVSHHIIHFPLMLIPSVAGLILFFSHDWYIVTLFAVCCLAHFVHDTASVTGVCWLWPISGKAFTFERGVIVVARDRDKHYSALKKGLHKRIIIDEIKMRMQGELSGRSIVLFVVAAGTLIFFWFN